MFEGSNRNAVVARCSGYRHPLLEAMTLFMAPFVSRECGWSSYRVMLACVLLSWEDAVSIVERFEVVREFLHHALPRTRGRIRGRGRGRGRGRRLGCSYQGLAKAMLRHGEGLIRQVQQHLRLESMARCGAARLRHGIEAVAVDGSRFDAPRTVSNEAGFGIAGKKGTHPQMMVTSIWHMGTGLLWDWILGCARASERSHLRQMIQTLPLACLLVLDAGFTGYGLMRQVLDSGRHVLVRVGSNVNLLVQKGDRARVMHRGGLVWLRVKGEQPILLRLVVINTGRHPVYLVTDILDKSVLSDGQIAELYAMRWGIEVFHRQAKQTLNRRKMRSASADRAKLEMHWTLVGLWLLMLLTAAELVARGIDPLDLSVAQAAKAMRRWIRRPGSRTSLRQLRRALRPCVKDKAPRRASKQSHRWPHKKRQSPPKPPRLREVDPQQLTICQRLPASKAAA